MLATYDLINELDRFKRGMDHLFNHFKSNDYNQDFPPINIVEEDDQIKVTALIPGVDPKDVDISLEKGILSLKGERKADYDESKKYIRQERLFGNFSRQFKLKVPVDTETVKAHYKNGVLEVTLNKAPEAKPIKIKID